MSNAVRVGRRTLGAAIVVVALVGGPLCLAWIAICLVGASISGAVETYGAEFGVMLVGGTSVVAPLAGAALRGVALRARAVARRRIDSVETLKRALRRVRALTAFWRSPLIARTSGTGRLHLGRGSPGSCPNAVQAELRRWAAGLPPVTYEAPERLSESG